MRKGKQFILHFLAIATLSSCLTVVKAQDVIYKTDRSEIEAKVQEIDGDKIRYKRFDHLDGPTYTIPKSDVFIIIYQNGKKETFDRAPVPKAAVASSTAPPDQSPVNQSKSVPTTSPSAIPAEATPTDSARTVGFRYNPSRLMVNLAEGFDFSFSGMIDAPLFSKKLEQPDIPIYAYLNIGLTVSGSMYSDEFSSLQIWDFGPYVRWYFPINKLAGSKKVDQGLFPFFYGGAVYRNSTFKVGSDKHSESTEDWIGGIGLDYMFTKRFGVTARYDADYEFSLGISIGL